jgi:hypothetical protein
MPGRGSRGYRGDYELIAARRPRAGRGWAAWRRGNRGCARRRGAAVGEEGGHLGRAFGPEGELLHPPEELRHGGSTSWDRDDELGWRERGKPWRLAARRHCALLTTSNPPPPTSRSIGCRRKLSPSGRVRSAHDQVNARSPRQIPRQTHRSSDRGGCVGFRSRTFLQMQVRLMG